MWELDYKESWALKNWTVVLKTLESPLDFKEIQPVNTKGNQSWIFIGRTDAKAPILWPHDEESTHWKRPWWWERLKAGSRGDDDRGWDGWMASSTQWMWVGANCGSWCWTGRPGVLQAMGSQRIGHDWAIELNWYSKHHCGMYVCVLKDSFRGIPRGSVVRILLFHCLDQGFYSWLGN